MPPPSNLKQPLVQTVHFYGYKGGQARSTILASLATALARDGWKVLVVDADVEAPSLDTIFGVSSRTLSRTLLGATQRLEKIESMRAYTSPAGEGEGFVDLINCWPNGHAYEIDAAAMALRTALEPKILEDAVSQISRYAYDNKFDLVLMDHRTGISPSVLPAVSAAPGAVVVTVRLDEQWSPARTFLRLLFRANPSMPGLLVFWKPDTEDERSFLQRNYRQREDLLQLLADSFENGTSADDDFSGLEIEDHAVLWSYDSSFRQSRLPETEMLGGQCRDALQKIRSLLGLGGSKRVVSLSGVVAIRSAVESPDLAAIRPIRRTSISGAADQGDLIITRALSDLLSRSSPHVYILGRKGTGKTRLARELSGRQIGEALLVPDDSSDENGIRSNSPEVRDAAKLCLDNPDRFWLALFNAAIHLPSTATGSLAKEFRARVEANEQASAIFDSWSNIPAQRSFLIDSVETAFLSKQMDVYLDGLFRVLSMIESDPRAAEKVSFKLFLRKDLAQRTVIQNIEQQLHGKTLELTWDYRSILNFCLSRIYLNEWYGRNFPGLNAELEKAWPRILRGDLSQQECEGFLLLAFPETVRRNNLRTTTFLRTYFADTASDRAPGASPAGSDNRRYYPRVFDEFVRLIPESLAEFDGSSVPATDSDSKIHQTRIFRAHEQAADSFLRGIKQELAFVVDLNDDKGKNEAAIERLLNAFDGRPTPFQLDECVAILSDLVEMDSSKVRSALEKMRDIGMFELRPDYAGEWRVGRLFKSSLKMKYVRKSR